MDLPSIDRSETAWISNNEMREVDRIMIEDLHIELVQMMENAGRNLARLVLHLASPSSACIFAGHGGNGGGGLVCARHLSNAGVEVSIALADADKMAAVPAHQLDICRRMNIPVGEPELADVAIDALIGYSLRGDPRGRTADLIDSINGYPNVVALDTPSGLDTSTGQGRTPCVSADATLTLALPKSGLRDAQQAGRFFLGDISVPPSVYDTIAVSPSPDFSRSTILEVL